VVRPAVDDISTGGQKYLPLEDGSFLAQGYAPTKHRVKLTVQTEMPTIAAFRLELLTDPNLPLGGPGRSVTGGCALTEFQVFAAETPIANPKGTVLTFYLMQNHGGWNSDDNQSNNLGRFRFSITADPGATADPLPASVRTLIEIPRERRTPAQAQTIFGYWR